MFMSEISRLLLLKTLPLLLLAAGELHARASTGLGVALTPADVPSIDFTVMPDGAGLPAGVGDAAAGAALYQQHCLACHGPDGEGGLNDRLVGGMGSIDGAAPLRTVGSYWPYATTLFDYIRRAMPYQAPGSLNATEIYAITAFLLYRNGIIDQHQPLDAASLPDVEMPNRNGFSLALPTD